MNSENEELKESLRSAFSLLGKYRQWHEEVRQEAAEFRLENARLREGMEHMIAHVEDFRDAMTTGAYLTLMTDLEHVKTSAIRRGNEENE